MGERAETLAIVARLAVGEALRRRAVTAVLAVSLLLLALFGLAADQALDAARAEGARFDEDVVGATLLGTAAFTDLLLGAIVAVFLSHAAVRGDAESGLLQPLLVRPVTRGAVVAGRAAAGAGVAAAYTLALWLAGVALLRTAGGWAPPSWLEPGLAIALAVALVALAAVAASTLFPAMAAGIVTLVLLGLGFTAGLLAQVGDTLDLPTLATVADTASVLLPFEALYRHALFELQGGLGDLAEVGAAAGPFGGARGLTTAGVAAVAAWALVVGGLAALRARRIDL